ncbi:MAG: glutathione transport system permease protein, partial [Actinomycetota bacterium]|nr:glutathione transport system permease protein [Actinomycetota bacterium]
MGAPGLAVFIVRRLLLSVLVVFVASIVTFVLVAASGDPLASYRVNPHAHQASIHELERKLNLDRPLPVRYALWAKGLVHGDLGRSVKDDDDVAGLVWRATGVTARLVFFAVAVALVLAVAIGSISAARPHSWVDHGGTLTAFVLLSIPAFWLGWILRDGAVHLNAAAGAKLLFFVGERSTAPGDGALASAADRVRHLVLPVVTLSLLAAAGWSRFLRSSMLDALGTDYVRTARAKGLPEWRVV